MLPISAADYQVVDVKNRITRDKEQKTSECSHACRDSFEKFSDKFAECGKISSLYGPKLGCRDKHLESS